MFRSTKKIATLAAVIASARALAAQPAFAGQSPNRAYATGGNAYGGGWDAKGVRDWGNLHATDSGCVHADVKLALSGYGDYRWTEARACSGHAASWNKTDFLNGMHYGP